MPTGRAVVLRDAWKRPPAAGTKAAEPNAVLPVANATDPVGMPTPAKLMVTVKVTDPPESTLDGLMNGVVAVMAVVVGAVLTVIVITDEALPTNEVDPR